MELVDGCLEKTLEAWATEPDWVNYSQLKNHLITNVYPNIGEGVALEDGLLLTDHGANHIQTVIAKASDLLKALRDDARLSVYETQLLLTAILSHDIGNINGRRQHAKRSADILSSLQTTGHDDIEKRIISKIAVAHSGIDGLDNSELKALERVKNNDVREKLLASILRLADELADDRTRSCFYKEIDIPRGSEIYHLYAHCLHSVSLVGEEKIAELKFEVKKEFLCKKWGKNDKESYLIDEIFLRTHKTFSEILYCSLGLTAEMRLEKVRVCIEIFENPSQLETPETIQYTLEKKGYPTSENDTIHAMCPELTDWGDTSGELSGEVLFKKYCSDENNCGGNDAASS